MTILDVQQPTEVSAIVKLMFDTHPIIATVIILILAMGAAMLGVVLYKERISRRAKDIAEAQNHMAAALKSNTESLASVPKIVESFTALVKDTIQRETEPLRASIGPSIEELFTQKQAELLRLHDEAKELLIRMKDAEEKVEAIRNHAENQQQLLDQSLLVLESKLPDYDLWKNVANVPDLRRQIEGKQWDEGKDIIAALQRLVEESENHPEQFPSKELELTGDWCRKEGQNSLALWFYERAAKRDPSSLSGLVELYALRAELIPAMRGDALAQLRQLSRKGENIARILNVFVSLNKYDELEKLCTELIEENSIDLKARSKVLRMRAMAKKELGRELISCLQDLVLAQEIDPDGVDIIKATAVLYESYAQYPEAIKYYRKLLMRNRAKADYYRFLADAYNMNQQPQDGLRILDLMKTEQVDDREPHSTEYIRKKILRSISANDDAFFLKL